MSEKQFLVKQKRERFDIEAKLFLQSEMVITLYEPPYTVERILKHTGLSENAVDITDITMGEIE